MEFPAFEDFEILEDVPSKKVDLGHLYKAKNKKNNETVALLKIQKKSLKPEELMPFEELKVLVTMLQHYNPEIPITHMVKVICTKDTEEEFMIMYEDLGDRTINTLLSEQFDCTREEDFIAMVYEVAKSLKDLKNFNIAHKGIHPSNVFKVNGVFKLGLPHIVHDKEDRVELNGDTYFYKAPDKRMST